MKTLTQEQYNEIINYELSFVGKKVEDIIGIPEWYSKYTMTTEQADKWKKWTIEYLRKTCKVSKKIAEREFPWIMLNHGLRIDDENKS